MKKNNCVDAYIEKNRYLGPSGYKMYLSYDGVDYCFLNQNNEALSFALSFKEKLNSLTDGMLFTDKYGLIDKKNNNTVLACIKGSKNIEKAIGVLIKTCELPDVQSDLTIHLDKKVYPLIRNNNSENNKKKIK